MARARRRPMEPGNALGRGLTRRTTPVPTGTAAENVRTLDQALGRREAARRLGVSERTLRRWRAGGTPTRGHADRLATEARTAREVRRARISPRREARLRNRGAYVRMAGVIGGGTPGARRSNRRSRTIGDEGMASIHLTGDQMGDILDKWESGDEAGALESLRDALAEEYGFENLTFEDLTMLEFLRDDPNR